MQIHDGKGGTVVAARVPLASKAAAPPQIPPRTGGFAIETVSPAWQNSMVNTTPYSTRTLSDLQLAARNGRPASWADVKSMLGIPARQSFSVGGQEWPPGVCPISRCRFLAGIGVEGHAREKSFAITSFGAMAPHVPRLDGGQVSVFVLGFRDSCFPARIESRTPALSAGRVNPPRCVGRVNILPACPSGGG